MWQRSRESSLIRYACYLQLDALSIELTQVLTLLRIRYACYRIRYACYIRRLERCAALEGELVLANKERLAQVTTASVKHQ